METKRPLRVVVVGAGPGGLAAAINLAGLGLDVTVVEKDAIPGGRMRGLSIGERGEYRLDSGPSILQLVGVLEKIFERSGKRLEDYLNLIPVEPNTRVHLWDGSQLDTSVHRDTLEASLAGLDRRLPMAMRRWMAVNEKKYAIAYEKFMATPAGNLGYYAPWRLLPTLRFKPWQTLYTHLDEFFHDDRVTYALAYPAKYLGLHPTTCSSVFSLIPYLELAFGVFYVKGGFQALARGMQRCAEDLGARFRFSSPVRKVWIDAGHARGVELEGGERLAADAVVVNADLPYAATRLIDPEWRAGTRLSDRVLESSRYSCSAYMLYLGLDRRYALPHHLIYLSANTRRTEAEFVEDRFVDLEDPPFYVCNATVTDPSGAPDGHSAIYVLVPTPNTHQRVDWAETERVLTDRVPRWLAKVGMHDVEKHIVARRAFTAETWRDDFNVFRGAVFNLAHNWLQLGPLRPRVKNPDVEGLYWVGGGTHPGSGLLTIWESANIAADYLAKAMGQEGLPGWPYVPPVPDASGSGRARDAA